VRDDAVSALDFLSAAARAELEQLIDEKVAERVAQLTAPVPASSPYLTIPEAADYLRCSRQRVDDLLSQGRLQRFKDGARTLVSRAEISDYLAAR
jgi:excisionase family DNA binding protein